MDIALGTASAALQIEGSMPENPWNGWARTGHVKDGSSPNPTTDHWVRWREDNELMGSLGLQIARIGVEWARIEPARGRYDDAALARYREEIADLRSRGIAPLVTLHHFGHPQWFEDMGAFTVDANVEMFLGFVDRVLEAVDDLVDDWVTINEPNVFVTQAYLFHEAPPGTTDLRAIRDTLRNLARAHCLAYLRIHERLDSPGRSIKVTFANHRRVFTPMNPRNPLHRLFTVVDEQLFHEIYERAFYSGIFHPLLGRARDVEPARYVDAIGLNYYSRTAVTGLSDGVLPGVPVTDLGWEIHPQGLAEASAELHARYPVEIWVTENGCADNPVPGGPAEKYRCDFIMAHLDAMERSGLPFTRYYHWCFVDNWEWSEGMTARFGIVALGEDLSRTPKPSALMMRDIIAAGGLTPEIRARYSEGSAWAGRL